METKTTGLRVIAKRLLAEFKPSIYEVQPRSSSNQEQETSTHPYNFLMTFENI